MEAAAAPGLALLFEQGRAALDGEGNLAAEAMADKEVCRNAALAMDKARAMCEAMDLFSENETIDDVSTKDVKYLLAPYYLACLLQSAPEGVAPSRARAVKQATGLLVEFLRNMERKCVFGDEHPLAAALARDLNAAVPPVSRREERIARHRRARQIKESLSALRRSRSGVGGGNDDDGDEGEDGADAREAWLLELELATQVALDSVPTLRQEAELLAERERQLEQAGDREEGDSAADGFGPAAPERPPPSYTIRAPPTRDEVLARVLRPHHNLPTMTLQEFAEREMAEARAREARSQAAEQRRRALASSLTEEEASDIETARLRRWDAYRTEAGWVPGWGNRSNRS